MYGSGIEIYCREYTYCCSLGIVQVNRDILQRIYICCSLGIVQVNRDMYCREYTYCCSLGIVQVNVCLLVCLLLENARTRKATRE